jgi:lipopolysaccharide transport system permease protein
MTLSPSPEPSSAAEPAKEQGSGGQGRSQRAPSRADDIVVMTRGKGSHESIVRRLRGELPLLWLWTSRELRARYRQSWLRAGWTVIQPVVLLMTYGWVLTAVLDVGDDRIPYLTFAWAGLGPFIFIQQALGAGVGSIQQSRHIITKVYFPREILPLSAVGTAFVDLVVMTAILVVLAWVQIGPPTIHLLAIVVVDAVLVTWMAALTMLAASAAVFRRDVIHVMPLVLRVLFIISPVMYATSLLEERAPAFVSWNPLTVTIEATRDVVTRHVWPDWLLLGVHGAVGVVLFLVAMMVMRSFERRMSDRA